jgi:hypothetical protein
VTSFTQFYNSSIFTGPPPLHSFAIEKHVEPKPCLQLVFASMKSKDPDSLPELSDGDDCDESEGRLYDVADNAIKHEQKSTLFILKLGS